MDNSKNPTVHSSNVSSFYLPRLERQSQSGPTYLFLFQPLFPARDVQLVTTSGPRSAAGERLMFSDNSRGDHTDRVAHFRSLRKSANPRLVFVLLERLPGWAWCKAASYQKSRKSHFATFVTNRADGRRWTIRRFLNYKLTRSLFGGFFQIPI